ncbi:hypothetical protein JRO89_XS11G0187900 [Xanthoceras sorbifolium]|uniref:Homeobox-leucine zipper protein ANTHOCYANINLESS 2-like n=1 Tax=Xanthoceras sorbifolium TaxID=99658 RepID=A0ABQ8HG40_9ROSI|nr:hypothetical protein JRO89_XS11G0187900 [Xanthoceras sorbifolium]
MADNGEMGLPGDLMGQNREEGYESRSGSDNIDNTEGGASAEDKEGNEEGPPRKRKYHRHTPLQIQELEAFFKECPHPDDKQRNDLSIRLGLESKQIKFWFQNRRTQMKTQMERHENVMLRQEHDKLRAENEILKEALKNPMCNNCGGPVVPGVVNNYEMQQLRIENARLKDELNRICSLANKFLRRPLSSSVNPIPPQALSAALELANGRNEFGGVTIPGNTMPTGYEFGDQAPAIMSWMKQPVNGIEIPYDRNMLVELAVAAMDELVKLAQLDGSLWVRPADGGREVLNQEEYVSTFAPYLGPKPDGFMTEASRETAVVVINSVALVETMMDPNRWVEMFPCMVSGAATLDMISSGISGTKNGTLQLMFAEFQALSPLVPTRQVRFLRFCKQHAEGLWAVVDVSIDINRGEGNNGEAYVTCRRLPSGCIVQEMPNNCSKVTWIEHSEYDENEIHDLCRPLVSSGWGFGAQRWIAILQRQCECSAVLMSSAANGGDRSGVTPDGRKSLLKLAERMMFNFFSGVCASSARKWDKLHVGNVGEDVRVLTHKNMRDPGEPSGIVLCAATSVWIPVTKQRLFDFMRNDEMRTQWDILSTNGQMQGIVKIDKDPGNCISILRANVTNPTETPMLILQETWNDASGSLVVYAPIDLPLVNMVMNGGDSTCVALLPSGFAILPDGEAGHDGTTASTSEASSSKGRGGGCILTIAFQILVNSLPTAKLTVESVETINNLISCTIQKIKANVQET